MFEKYFEGEMQKIVSGIRRRKSECARKVWRPTNFILDSKIVKNFSIGIKVSSRNAASETFLDFMYLLTYLQRTSYFFTFSVMNEFKTKLVVFMPTKLFDHFMQIVRLNLNL